MLEVYFFSELISGSEGISTNTIYLSSTLLRSIIIFEIFFLPLQEVPANILLSVLKKDEDTE